MAFRTKKISQMDPKGSNLASTDLLEISQLVSGSYVTKSITGAQIAASAPATAWGAITGTLSAQTDLNTALSGKVPTTRTLTINGTTQDLSADRTFTVSTGITIGTTAITSGTVGRVLFEGTGNVVQESANLFWDNTNGRLGIGGTPTASLFTKGIGATSSTFNFRAENSNARIILQAEDGGVVRMDGPTPQLIIGLATGGFGVPLVVKGGVHFSISGTSNGGATYFDQSGTSSASRIIQYDGTGNTKNLFTANGASYIQGGNVLINTTTDAGFKLDVNGTARVNNMFSVTNTSFTGSLRMESFGNNTQRIIGGPSENITFGPSNKIVINSGETYFSGSLLGQAFWMQSNGSTVIGAQSTPPASTLVEMRSTTKGFLPPRMTTTQKNAIATPATGLMVYDTTLNLISVYNGTTWITL